MHALATGSECSCLQQDRVTLFLCPFDGIDEQVGNAATEFREETGNARLGQVPGRWATGEQVIDRQVLVEGPQAVGDSVLLQPKVHCRLAEGSLRGVGKDICHCNESKMQARSGIYSTRLSLQPSMKECSILWAANAVIVVTRVQVVICISNSNPLELFDYTFTFRAPAIENWQVWGRGL